MKGNDRLEQLERQIQQLRRRSWAGWAVAFVGAVVIIAMGAAANQQPLGLIARVKRLEEHVHVANDGETTIVADQFVVPANAGAGYSDSIVDPATVNGNQVQGYVARLGNKQFGNGEVYGAQLKICRVPKEGNGTNDDRHRIVLDMNGNGWNNISTRVYLRNPDAQGLKEWGRSFSNNNELTGSGFLCKEKKLVRYLEIQIPAGGRGNTNLNRADWIVGFVGFADAGGNQAHSVIVTLVGNDPRWHVQLDPSAQQARKVKLIAIHKSLFSK